jgi:hypothetical protein
VETLLTNRRVFRAAPDRQFAMKTLVVAAFSLLCAGCNEAPANCRGEVAATFERLRTSGQPYRKERVVGGHHETSEFLPPDRMRQITNDGIPGHGTVEIIRVGARAWSKEKDGWHELVPGVAQLFSPRLDLAVPANTVFECLGRVKFQSTAYLGYRARFNQAIAVPVAVPVARNTPLSETKQQELSRELQEMPQEWRTVFIDTQSTLPAHDLVAQENQLDSPRDKVQYTYPNSMKIEPPVWQDNRAK